MKVVPRAKISLKPLSKFRGPLLSTENDAWFARKTPLEEEVTR